VQSGQKKLSGQIGAMPSWKENPTVMKNLDNLYRYLKARVGGKLPKRAPMKNNR